MRRFLAMNKLSDIKNRKYTGYIWKSDDKRPLVLINEEYDFSLVKTNPFIIEALLYSEQDKISLTIKHTGRYHINEIPLNKLEEGAELQDRAYLPHRLNGVEKVCFKQLWLPEIDENCNKLPVLKMNALVFTGFKLKK